MWVSGGMCASVSACLTVKTSLCDIYVHLLNGRMAYACMSVDVLLCVFLDVLFVYVCSLVYVCYEFNSCVILSC